MNALDLIGKVTAAALRANLNESTQEKNTARFLLDRLTAEQVVHICAEIYKDPTLEPYFQIRIPAAMVTVEQAQMYGLPESCLTEYKATYWRNAHCERQALLLANTSDDQGQSLKELTTINADMLKSYIDIWCKIASEGLSLIPQNIKHWEQALKGLEAAVPCSLMQFAEYILNTRERIENEKIPLLEALGWALPAISTPRDSGLFQTIPPQKRTHKAEWQKRFQQTKQQRTCFLEKQSPNRDILDDEELLKRFNEHKENIPALAHNAIEAFLNASPGWSEASKAISQFEWESQGINLLFAFKQAPPNLAEMTLEYYGLEYPNVLKPGEIDYLHQLKKRKLKEPVDQDREFYETHREDLSGKPSLKSKWDKFIYGNAIECTDFIAGLLSVLARFIDQSERSVGKKTLHIRTHKDASRSKWLELNSDAGLYFSTRYKGLPALLGAFATWDTHWLLKYDQLIASEKERAKSAKTKKKSSRNTSAAKAANELKFYIEFHYEFNGSQRKEEVQLIWRFNPFALATKLEGDLYRLRERPFVSAPVFLEPVSQKGALQTLALNNIGTFQALYRQERGTLIPAYQKDKDQGSAFEQSLKESKGELNEPAYKAIQTAWKNFKEKYKAALDSWYEFGISQSILWEQAKSFQNLIQTLIEYASDDTSRQKLWVPIFKIGHHHVGDRPLSIISPWHPLRMAALLVKDQQAVQLTKQLLGIEPNDFSDTRLYFSELIQELEHPFYPEIAAYMSSPPELLSVTETLYDYSLMERPVNDANHDDDAYEDPTEASKRIKNVIERYLELLPHEQTSLDVVLYNCDNALLPQSTIKLLSETYSESDVICQLMLRHSDRAKLTQLYRNLIETTNQDENSIIASEYTLDFMSRFRIALMPDTALNPQQFGKPADIVFLQDVISRHADIVWLPVMNHFTPSIQEHIPPRWSKRKAQGKGEQKGSQYLACPVQPEEGQTYIRALEYLVNRSAQQIQSAESYRLPVRQIYLQDSNVKQTIEEVHRLGEWVVNYDDLLDRRQLHNFGVQVIRFQQRRTTGRNLLISSNSSLSLLQVLVRRRLEELNLQYTSEELGDLVKKLIDDANLVSGDLVLRAAKRGVFSKELVGVVLSLALLRSEIGVQEPMGVYFLDDYAAWLGQKEQRIADLLVLNPRGEGENRKLHILVSEAKYVDASNASSSATSSANQLRDTLSRISKALYSQPACLDRELWLARFGEMLMEGLGTQQQQKDFSREAEAWRADLIQGKIPIELHGYSHVFVSGPSDFDVESQQLPIQHTNGAIQEIFNRNSVKQLVKAYAKDAYDDMIALRKSLGVNKTFETLKISGKGEHSKEPSPETEAVSKSDHKQPDNSVVNKKDPSPPELPKPIPEQKSQGDASVGANLESGVWPPAYLNNWLHTHAVQHQQEDESKLLEETAQRLRNALYSYELPAKILEARLTPNSILLQLQGSDQLTLSAIEKRRSQLLTTHALNIVYLSERPGAVVISVERPKRQQISFADTLLERKVNWNHAGMNMSLLTGVKELDGQLLYLNVESGFEGLEQHAPHTLIAGATGSGKSVLLQNLLLDIALTNPPELAKICLIDPKGVDYLHLEPLPHLGGGIIYEQEEAAHMLNQLVDEMESRYRQFREQRVNKLSDYNRAVPAELRLPAIWLVHDEFADWMMLDEYKEAVTTAVKRLGVKARAAGIHLIFAAQRPDANVFPPQLRDQLGNRLILKLESEGTSLIALGDKGAEKLLGKGHLAARMSGEPSLIYAQVPFLTSVQIEQLVSLIKQHYAH